MCEQRHIYWVEQVGQKARFAGIDEERVVSVVRGIDGQSFVLAEHVDAPVYCRAESERIESMARDSRAYPASHYAPISELPDPADMHDNLFPR